MLSYSCSSARKYGKVCAVLHFVVKLQAAENLDRIAHVCTSDVHVVNIDKLLAVLQHYTAVFFNCFCIVLAFRCTVFPHCDAS